MTHERKDQKPTREEVGQHEHAEQQRPNASKKSPAEGGASSDATQRPTDADIASQGTASPSPEPVPDVRRGALNTVAGREKESGASEQSGESPKGTTERASVESAIDPEATSSQGGASTDTMSPGGRRS